MPLNSLSDANLGATERATLAWLRRQKWEQSFGNRYILSIAVEYPPGWENTPHVKGNGDIGAGEIEGLIHILEWAGVISKQEPYPLKGVSAPHDWSISMSQADLNNIGIHPERGVASGSVGKQSGRRGGH
jgi:hypothetical protein